VCLRPRLTQTVGVSSLSQVSDVMLANVYVNIIYLSWQDMEMCLVKALNSVGADCRVYDL